MKVCLQEGKVLSLSLAGNNPMSMAKWLFKKLYFGSDSEVKAVASVCLATLLKSTESSYLIFHNVVLNLATIHLSILDTSENVSVSST